MILSIVFLLLFFIVAVLLAVFVFSVFIPSVRQNDDGGMQGYIFAPDEMRVFQQGKRSLSDTGLRAVVKCNSSKEFSSRRLDYTGLKDCRLFHDLYQSEFDCLYQCIGFGSCVAQCPQQAIRIQNGTALVTEGCIGCGRCVDICPKNVIELFPSAVADRTMLCCSEDDTTSCTAYRSAEKTPAPKRKIFKFWKICYRIFYKEKG